MKFVAPTLISAALAVAACKGPDRVQGSSGLGKFQEAFPKPEWFDAIPAPDVNTSREVSALWQSEKRCCDNEEAVLKNNRVFYKSCFNAIQKHFNDEELVVKCLWLMDAGADTDQRMKLSEFLVENYSHHRNSIDDCVNCMPGDTVARVTLDVARHESRLTNSKDGPIARIESLLDARRDEISYWVQAELYEFLGELYLHAGVTEARIARFKTAYEELNRTRKFNEPLERRFAPVERIYNLMLQTKDEHGERPKAKSSG